MSDNILNFFFILQHLSKTLNVNSSASQGMNQNNSAG